MSDTSKSRGGPVDVAINTGKNGQNGWDSRTVPDGTAARDKDYFGNLKKFERKDDMSAPPNRNKGSDWKP